MNILVALIYPLILCVITGVLLSHKKIRAVIFKHTRLIIVFVIVNVIIINALLSLHLIQESFIAFWDFGGYWRKTLEVVAMAERSNMELFNNLIYSINYTEYSYLAEIFLYLPIKILGNSFNDFVIAMFNFFVIPFNTMLFTFYLLYKDKNKQALKYSDILVASFIILFAGNLNPLVLGYIGSCGLVFIMPVLMLIYVDAFKKLNIHYALFSGLCLLIMVICRRWFAFWVVGFFASFVMNTIIYTIKNKKLNIKEELELYINLFITGIVPLSLLLIFFMPMVETFTNNNYAESYSVVWGNSPLEAVIWFFQYYGIVVVMMMFTALYASLKNKNIAYFNLLLMWQVLVPLILFNQLQGLGTHHYYMINVPAMMLIIMGLNYLLENKNRWQTLLVCMLVLISLFNFSKTILFSKNTTMYQVVDKLGYLTGDPLPQLRVRNDIDDIRALCDFIEYYADEEFEYVYSLASGSQFNTDTLRYSWFPIKEEPITNLLPTKIYDFRDGIPTDFFFYKYIVLSTPIELHVAENQYTLSILQNFIHDDEISKPYYRVINEIEIDNGRKVYVYERIALVPNEVRTYVSNQFKEIYPDSPDLYEFEMLPE